MTSIFNPKNRVTFTMPLYGNKILKGVVTSMSHVEGMGMLVHVFVSTDSIGLIQIHEKFLERLIKMAAESRKAAS